jgi:hypothetical protein
LLAPIEKEKVVYAEIFDLPHGRRKSNNNKANNDHSLRFVKRKSNDPGPGAYHFNDSSRYEKSPAFSFYSSMAHTLKKEPITVGNSYDVNTTDLLSSAKSRNCQKFSELERFKYNQNSQLKRYRRKIYKSHYNNGIIKSNIERAKLYTNDKKEYLIKHKEELTANIRTAMNSKRCLLENKIKKHSQVIEKKERRMQIILNSEIIENVSKNWLAIGILYGLTGIIKEKYKNKVTSQQKTRKYISILNNSAILIGDIYYRYKQITHAHYAQVKC